LALRHRVVSNMVINAPTSRSNRRHYCFRSWGTGMKFGEKIF